MKKVEKLLTSARECDTIKKLLSTAMDRKSQKTLKKVVDKRNEVMYNSNVPPEAACTL